MIKLLNFIIEVRDAFILVLCILLSLVLIVTSDADPASPFRRITLNTVGSFGGVLFRIGSYFRLGDEVRELREKNADLAYKYMQVQDALLENIRLRKLLAFKERSAFNLISAQVIGQNPQGILNGLILNEGANRGIEELDAVLTADGLVGKIIRVDDDFSICQILFDRNSRISAKIQRNRELGVISWDGGSYLELLYVAKTIEVLPGDIIVTSGYSQIFPEDIKIGVVVDVSAESEDMFQELTVRPSVEFSRLEEVHIIKLDKGDGGGE